MKISTQITRVHHIERGLLRFYEWTTSRKWNALHKMSFSGVLASFHYVALAVGISSLVIRGAGLSRIVKDPSTLSDARDGILKADSAYGLAALLWIVTGVWRAFGGLEKGTDYYLGNPLFWVKLGVFGGVFLMELPIMIELIRWRIAGARKLAIEPKPIWAIYARLNTAEIVFVGLIVFIASQMARFTIR
jgi:putative membrane protein